jgi:hypothetical protein
MIPSLTDLRTMPGSAVLVALRDSLFEEADRIGGMETVLRPNGWDAGRASAHHALAAAGEIVERLRLLGEEAKARKQKPNPVVHLVADIARSILILERQKQQPAHAPTEPAEAADAAAVA